MDDEEFDTMMNDFDIPKENITEARVIHIIENYDDPIINQKILTDKDIKDTLSLTNWLNKNIVNKYLADGQDYHYTEDKFGNNHFADVDVSLLGEFISLFKNKRHCVYIYGDDPTYYQFFIKINKLK